MKDPSLPSIVDGRWKHLDRPRAQLRPLVSCFLGDGDMALLEAGDTRRFLRLLLLDEVLPRGVPRGRPAAR